MEAAATQTVVSTIISSTTAIRAQLSGHGINGCEAAGIAIGSLVFGALVAAGLTLCLIRRKKNKDAPAVEHPGHQSMGYVQHEQYPSTFASPQTQFSTPISPHMYSASPPPPESSFHQPGFQRPGELVADAPKEMDASPVIRKD